MRNKDPERASRRRNVRPRVSLWVLGFTLLVGSAVTGASSSSTKSSAANRFLAQQETELTQYRAFRRMHARSERFNQEAWLDAWTEMNGRTFTYTIVAERGSEYVRNKVLKGVLKREQELIEEGHAERAGLTTDNYEFTDGAARDDGLRYVLLKPKRKDVLLVNGRMVLSQDGTELLRVEGRLAKNPSFWTSLVNVVRHFAKVDGVRVPVSTESLAKVKLAGESTLDVRYEYESINGRPVSLTTRHGISSSTASSR